MSDNHTDLLQAEIDRLHSRLTAAENELQQLRPLLGCAPPDAEPDRVALVDSRQQYQRLLDKIDEGYCIIQMKFDADGRGSDYQFIETNRAFELHTGLVNVQGRWMRDLMPDHEQHWFDIYGQVAKTGRSVRYENRAQTLGRWFDVQATAIGGGTQVALLFSDTTAQRNAEQALRDSEQYWQGIFERLNDSFILGELVRDASGAVMDWKYLDVNPAWGTTVGLDPAMAKGNTLSQLFPGIEAFWTLEPAHVVAQQQSVAFKQHVRKSNRWYEGRIHPLGEDRFSIIFRDVSEVHSTLLRRQALLEFGNTLQDMQVPEAMTSAAVETVGSTLGASGVCYFALRPGDETVTDCWSCGQAKIEYRALFKRLPAADRLAIADVREDARTLGWQERGVLSVLSVPLLESGLPVAVLWVVHNQPHAWSEAESRFARDVAERTRSAVARRKAESALRELNAALEHTVNERTEELLRSEEQLRQSQKMEAVGQLTGGIAHDFNNLLTGISGSLEMMQSRILQGRLGELDKYILAAHGASKRAAALTHRLLAFSRRQTLDPKPTHINQLVAGLEDLILRTVGPAVHTRTLLGDDIWATYVDAHQLENALLNLCINARDAMPDGGLLTVQTANRTLDGPTAATFDLAPGQYVSLCVSDTGIGMSAEVAQRAFEPFFTTKPIGMGTGLGLSMIYGFTRQSGGQARIHSTVGEGSTLCLYLPRYLGEEVEAPPLQLGEIPRAEAGETVLVVDDEPTVRLLVAEILEELGYHAIEAPDGPSGLKILESNVRIDLLVSDVGLPGNMNGRQMADLARIRRPGLKVLFITGYAEKTVLSSGDLDANMHIMTKPFSVEGLAVRIKSLIEHEASAVGG